MLDALGERLATAIQANLWLGLPAALLGGLLTAANPCVLAAAPLMVAYVVGQKQRTVARCFLLSLTFALGLTLTFLAMWLGFHGASRLVPRAWWTYLTAGICLLMGLHLLGLLNIRIPAMGGWQPKQRGFIGALLLGLLFGIISTPCAGPVLLALLSLSQLQGVDYVLSIALVVAYSLGHCGLVLVGGTSMAFAQKAAESKGWLRGTDLLRRAVGVLIAGVGIWLLLDHA